MASLLYFLARQKENTAKTIIRVSNMAPIIPPAMPPFSAVVNPAAPADAVCEGTMDEEAEVELEEVVVAEEANVEELEFVKLNNGTGVDDAVAPMPVKEGVALKGSYARC